MAVVAGIDGCPSGWLCLTKDLATGTVQARILKKISDLLALAPRPEVVMVDIPIGLTDAGPRTCDLDARVKLKRPRSSSVFPAPIRPTLIAATYAQACQIGEAADGRKLSKQSWASSRRSGKWIRSSERTQRSINGFGRFTRRSASGRGAVTRPWRIARSPPPARPSARRWSSPYMELPTSPPNQVCRAGGTATTICSTPLRRFGVASEWSLASSFSCLPSRLLIRAGCGWRWSRSPDAAGKPNAAMDRAGTTILLCRGTVYCPPGH